MDMGCVGLWETLDLLEQHLEPRQDIPLFLQKKKEQQNPALHLLCSDVRSSIFSSHEDIHGLIVNHQTEYHPEISTSFSVC